MAGRGPGNPGWLADLNVMAADFPDTPQPATATNPLTGPGSGEAATMAAAIACSEADSTAAARPSTSSRSRSLVPEPAIVTVLTASCPTVNVPVLSNTTVSMLRMVSSARYP